MPLGLQAKLLRVLQEEEIRRVGDHKTRRVDVRLLAATARSLDIEVGAGRFREDLFYRLKVVTIQLPPLVQRREDIMPLARHFAARLARRLGRRLDFAPESAAWLEAQRWPGNVRELENAIERAAVLSGHELLQPNDLLQDAAPSAATQVLAAAAGRTLREIAEGAERQAILEALQAADGNRRAAAQQLGISLRTLFYKMQRYRLE
jgi:DNA-binding NtrC family response regulator